MARHNKTLLERVHAHVQKDDESGHWYWDGPMSDSKPRRHRRRFGLLSTNRPRPTIVHAGKKHSPARVLYEERFGEIPQGNLVRNCSIPKCINPAHKRPARYTPPAEPEPKPEIVLDGILEELRDYLRERFEVGKAFDRSDYVDFSDEELAQAIAASIPEVKLWSTP